MDSKLRELQRANSQGPEQQVHWLRAKIRSDQLSESMRRMLCALGYEPMVLALGYPAKTSSAQKSFMAPHTFCNYKNGRWLLGMDHTRIAKYLCKKHWSRIVCMDLLHNRVTSMDYIRESETGFSPIEIIDDGIIIDGQAYRGMPSYFYNILAQQLRNKEVRDALIARLLNRLT